MKSHNTEKNLGRLWINSDTIQYNSQPNESWTIPLPSLAIIGEYTNPFGPNLIDYYFVFVVGREQAYAAPFYSEGREAFLKALSAHFKVPFQCALIGSTDYGSNVLWPEDISGKPLYEFVDRPSKGVTSKILKWFGVAGKDVTYSVDVLTRLR